MEPLDFLKELHGPAADEGNGKILIWIKAGTEKTSHYFNTVEDAYGEAVRSENREADVYMGVGLCPEGLPRHRRARADDVTCIPALWADLDYRKANDAKLYPTDQADALAIVEQAGVPPTAIIESGGGLQAWWLFHEPWVLDSPDARREAAGKAKRWVDTLRAVAADRDRTLDAVGDLARVMRVPGSVNNKYDPPRDVRVLRFHDERRYSPEDFDAYLVAEEFAPGADSTARVEVGGIEIREAPAIPDEVARLMESDDKFKRTWNKRRRDLGDQSASSYDLAIANEGSYRGWSDQTIADAIGAWRRIHGADETKARRRDYLQRTIAKAKAAHQTVRALNEIQNEVHDASAEVDAERRRQLLDKLGDVLGRRVRGFIRLSGERPVYTLQLADPDMDVRLGHSQSVQSFSAVRATLFDADVQLDKKLAKKWDDVASLLLKIVETVDNPDDTVKARVERWVSGYLDRRRPQEEGWRPEKTNRLPLFYRGLLCIHAGDLRRHLEIEGERMETISVYDDLRAYGFKPTKIKAACGTTTVHYWGLPVDDAPAMLPQVEQAVNDEPGI